MTAPVMMVMQMPMVVIMADRGAAVQSAIQAALSSPKAALEHIALLRVQRGLPRLSSPELWVLRAILARGAEKAKVARRFTPREREVFSVLEERRAAGKLEPGAKHLLDQPAFRAFAPANGFPAPPSWLHLPEWEELVAADLLWRYGWTPGDAGAPLADWAPDHQREILEIVGHIRPPVVMRRATAPVDP